MMDIFHWPTRWSERLAVLALVSAGIGIFGGNRVIAFSHFAVSFCAVAFYIEAFYFSGCEKLWDWKVTFKGSFLALVFLVFAIVCSIFSNWDTYASPWIDLKKVRYELLLLTSCAIPVFHRMLIRDGVLFWLIWLGVSSVVIVAVSGIIAVFIGYHPFIELVGNSAKAKTRVGGISGSVMSFAYTMQFIVLLSGAVLFAPTKYMQWIAKVSKLGRFARFAVFIFTLVCFLSLFWSQSRGAMFGVAFGGLIYVILRRSKIIYAIASIFLIFVVSGAFLTSTRYSKIVSNGDRIRVAQWQAAILTFADNPLVGVGHRQFEKRTAEIKESLRMPFELNNKYFIGHSHNNFLESFACNGIIGGLAFIGFIVYWGKEVFELPGVRLFFLPLIGAFAVSGLFECTFTDSEVLHSILFLYLVSQTVIKLEQERNVSPVQN